VEKIFSALPSGMKSLLDQCIARGLYGDQAMTVRHFVTIGLEQLVEQGRLADIGISPASPKNESGGPSGEGKTR
jgi:hypothetical protein